MAEEVQHDFLEGEAATTEDAQPSGSGDQGSTQEPPRESEPAKPSADELDPQRLIPVYFRVRYQSHFPGEIAGIPKPVAEQKIKEGKAYPVKKQKVAGKMQWVPVRPAGSKKQESDKGDSNTPKPDATVDEKNPFVVDGFSVSVAKSLAGSGIKTIDDLLNYVSSGRELSDVVSPSQAKKLLETYGDLLAED